jgi:hypothetical protein
MGVSDQVHVLAALRPKKSLCYPLDRMLSERQSQSGRCGENKNILSLILPKLTEVVKYPQPRIANTELKIGENR